MKIDFDRDADALTLILGKGTVTKDKKVAESVFAGINDNGELIELQILDISAQERVWITVDAAAKLLGKSDRTILRWIQSGKLKSKRVGREYRIALEDINDLAR